MPAVVVELLGRHESEEHEWPENRHDQDHGDVADQLQLIEVNCSLGVATEEADHECDEQRHGAKSVHHECDDQSSHVTTTANCAAVWFFLLLLRGICLTSFSDSSGLLEPARCREPGFEKPSSLHRARGVTGLFMNWGYRYCKHKH